MFAATPCRSWMRCSLSVGTLLGLILVGAASCTAVAPASSQGPPWPARHIHHLVPASLASIACSSMPHPVRLQAVAKRRLFTKVTVEPACQQGQDNVCADLCNAADPSSLLRAFKVNLLMAASGYPGSDSPASTRMCGIFMLMFMWAEALHHVWSVNLASEQGQPRQYDTHKPGHRLLILFMACHSCLPHSNAVWTLVENAQVHHKQIRFGKSRTCVSRVLMLPCFGKVWS